MHSNFFFHDIQELHSSRTRIDQNPLQVSFADNHPRRLCRDAALWDAKNPKRDKKMARKERSVAWMRRPKRWLRWAPKRKKKPGFWHINFAVPRCFPKVTVNAQAEKPGQHDAEPYLISGNQNQWCLMIFLFCLGSIWISTMSHGFWITFRAQGDLYFAELQLKWTFLVVSSFPSNKNHPFLTGHGTSNHHLVPSSWCPRWFGYPAWPNCKWMGTSWTAMPDSVSNGHVRLLSWKLWHLRYFSDAFWGVWLWLPWKNSSKKNGDESWTLLKHHLATVMAQSRATSDVEASLQRLDVPIGDPRIPTKNHPHTLEVCCTKMQRVQIATCISA